MYLAYCHLGNNDRAFHAGPRRLIYHVHVPCIVCSHRQRPSRRLARLYSDALNARSAFASHAYGCVVNVLNAGASVLEWANVLAISRRRRSLPTPSPSHRMHAPGLRSNTPRALLRIRPDDFTPPLSCLCATLARPLLDQAHRCTCRPELAKRSWVLRAENCGIGREPGSSLAVFERGDEEVEEAGAGRKGG